MPELRPWRNDDVVVRPQLERQPTEFGAIDRMVRAGQALAVSSFHRGPKTYAKQIDQILSAGKDAETLTSAALREQAEMLRGALRRDGFTPELVRHAFGLVQAAAHRRLGIRYFPVQLMGGLALLDGRLVEMATGEGKTVTAALAAATAALAALPVHVVTVNDYLAGRDAAQLAPVYSELGLSVGAIQHETEPKARQQAYAADITYVANKEIGFDYLRDHLARRRSIDPRAAAANAGMIVLRGLGYAIVDEADSALIDEARTPLIIAERTGEPELHYQTVLDIARSLQNDTHYTLNIVRRSVELTAAGRSALAAHADALGGMWRHLRAREEMTEQALAALYLFQRDRHYILRDGKVHIVDEYTGRVAEGRNWERGLHQLIEVKEGAAVSPQNRTTARITYQSFFRRYVRLSGMSGTAKEHTAEFHTVYGLGVVSVPTHRPPRRQCLGRALAATSQARWYAVAEAAAREVAKGRPVLIGTRSVSASEMLSAVLTERGLEHTVLNARQDKDEAEVVAQAGHPGRITVATNMAGRGTDIRLSEEVVERGGLHVILTEYHESARIDRQLIGRCARQGDPGSWEAIVSVEDELFGAHTRRLCEAAGHWRSEMALEALRRAAQFGAELRHARDRRTLLAAERAARRMFAFAGEGAWL